MEIKLVQISNFDKRLLVLNEQDLYLHKSYLDNNSLTAPIIWTSKPSDAFVCLNKRLADELLDILHRHMARSNEEGIV